MILGSVDEALNAMLDARQTRFCGAECIDLLPSKKNSARRPDVRARGGHDGKAAPSRRTGISSGSDIRKNNCHTDQEPDESTRPGARLFAGCCLCVRFAIRDDPNEAATLTSRANLVAVITNGTAVLGLGNIGALAGKPVMEGKAYLFKKFAGTDVFDIEIN